jgi:hypothetical protein
MSNDVDKTDDELIHDYKRVEAFLADPAVKDAIRTVRDRFYEVDFKQAKTPADREMAFAKSAALDALAEELIRTMAKGQAVAKAREITEQREARRLAAEARNGSKR